MLPTSTDEIALLEQQIADGTATQESRAALARAYHEAGQLALQKNHPADAQRALARYLRVAPSLKDRRETLKQLQNLVGDEPLVCEGCGRQSPIASAFAVVHQHGKENLFCPRCRTISTPYSAFIKQNAYFITLLVLVTLALISFWWSPRQHFYITNVLLLFLVYPPLILLHESAHGIATKLMGGKVFALDIGQGELAFQIPIGNCIVRVRRLLVSGLAWAGFSTLSMIRQRTFVAVSAPLFLHLTLLMVGFFALEWQSFNRAYVPFQTFWLLNLYALLISLFPRIYENQGQIHRSDGAVLLTLIRKEVQDEELHQQFYSNGITCHIQNRQYEESFKWCEQALTDYPNHLFFLIQRAHILLLLRRYEIASTEWKSLLARDDLPPVQRGIAYNNYAWSLLMNGNPQDALVQARCAYALLPWGHYMEGTLGATMIETGTIEEGIKLLVQAGDAITLQADRASHFAHLALAYAKLGKKSESQHYWSQALKLERDNEAIAHVRPKLESIGY